MRFLRTRLRRSCCPKPRLFPTRRRPELWKTESRRRRRSRDAPEACSYTRHPGWSTTLQRTRSQAARLGLPTLPPSVRSSIPRRTIICSGNPFSSWATPAERGRLSFRLADHGCSRCRFPDEFAQTYTATTQGLARIIRKGSDFGSQDGVIVSRTKDRTLPLSSAGHVGRKIGRMARCERPAGQLRRGRSREAR